MSQKGCDIYKHLFNIVVFGLTWLVFNTVQIQRIPVNMWFAVFTEITFNKSSSASKTLVMNTIFVNP